MIWTANNVAHFATVAGWQHSSLAGIVAHVCYTSACDDTHQVPAGDPMTAREAGLAGVDVVKWHEYATAGIYRPVDNLRAALALHRDHAWSWTWHGRDPMTLPADIVDAALAAILAPQRGLEADVVADRAFRQALLQRPPR